MEAGFAIARQGLHPKGLCDQISSLGLCFPELPLYWFSNTPNQNFTRILLNAGRYLFGIVTVIVFQPGTLNTIYGIDGTISPESGKYRGWFYAKIGVMYY